jgi:glycosyltransferase involved in cell wall biosynthesis
MTQINHPQLSGFTFLRNAVMLGFPFEASIRSILPIVDEFVVVIGQSDDDTLNRVLSINSPKIRVIQTIWNEKMTQKGFVYAQQKMIAQYACLGDWVFYLEADEIIHEQDHANILEHIKKHHANLKVEAFVFDYYHFYGSPEWIAISPAWYRRECRILRNTIRSFAPDGQYWVVMERNRRGRHPYGVLINAPVYHYGHVRPTKKMNLKLEKNSKYWDKIHLSHDYRNVDIQALKRFSGTHPKYIQEWLDHECSNNFLPNPNHQLTTREKKHRISMFFEHLFGIDLSRKHYILITSK